MLVLWANMHGSAALGALLVVLLGAYELVRSRGGTWKRSLALIVLAPLAILATPYGPVTTARYYHLLLVDPPFAGQVTEWRWPEPASNTYAFYVLLAMAVPLVIWGRRRLTAFDIGVLALTLAGALTRDPRDPVVRLRMHGVRSRRYRPETREPASPGEPRRGLNTRRFIRLSAAIVVSAAALFFRSDAWFEDYWPNEPAQAIRAELQPGDRASFPIASPTGCCGGSRSFEAASRTTCASRSTTRAFFERLANYNGERAPTGSRSRTATGSSSWTRRTARTLPTSEGAGGTSDLPGR